MAVHDGMSHQIAIEAPRLDRHVDRLYSYSSITLYRIYSQLLYHIPVIKALVCSRIVDNGYPTREKK